MSFCFILFHVCHTGLEAEFLDKIQTKDLIVFLRAIHSHLGSFPLRFLFLQTHAISYTLQSSVTVQKGGKPEKNHIPLPCGLRNLYRNSQDYAQKPKQNCKFMNSASVQVLCLVQILRPVQSKEKKQIISSIILLNFYSESLGVVTYSCVLNSRTSDPYHVPHASARNVDIDSFWVKNNVHNK